MCEQGTTQYLDYWNRPEMGVVYALEDIYAYFIRSPPRGGLRFQKTTLLTSGPRQYMDYAHFLAMPISAAFAAFSDR